MKNYTAGLALLVLSSCISKPEVVKVEEGNEAYMDCHQLSYQMQKAQAAKAGAEADDRFRASYIFPPSGAISVVNIMRAKSSAEQRINLLSEIMQSKGCYY